MKLRADSNAAYYTINGQTGERKSFRDGVNCPREELRIKSRCGFISLVCLQAFSIRARDSGHTHTKSSQGENKPDGGEYLMILDTVNNT